MTGEDYEELKSRLAGQAMTHDELCEPPGNMDDLNCCCDLIARVREDERGKQFISDQTMTRIADGIAKATPVDEATWSQSTYDTGYAAALRDAVEAVKAARSADVSTQYVLDQPAEFVWLHHAVAAIEALTRNNDPAIPGNDGES